MHAGIEALGKYLIDYKLCITQSGNHKIMSLKRLMIVMTHL